MKSRGSASSSTASSILDKRQYDRGKPFINYPREVFPCPKKRNVFNGTGGVNSRGSPNDPREVEEPLLFATPSREVEEPLFFETPSPGAYEGSRRDCHQHGTNLEPCPLRMRQAQGEFKGRTVPRRRSSRDMTDLTALHRLSRTGTRRGGGKRACLFPAALFGSWASGIDQKTLGTSQGHTS